MGIAGGDVATVVIVSQDGAQARCTLCSPDEFGAWMKKTSLSTHLKSKNHLACADEHAQRAARISSINATLARENQRRDQQNPVRLAALDMCNATTNMRQPTQTVSAGEQHMWDEFNMNRDDIRFDAGEDPAAAPVAAQQLWQRQAHEFTTGLWNAHATAEQLGFGSRTGADDLPIEYTLNNLNDDEILADLLASIGKGSLKTSVRAQLADS